jgi:predicted metal-dependent enzyme (double-stranded beta helix superfamily)
MHRQTLAPGYVHGFEAGHRHDVVNDGPEVALSVHVYSPPLSSMTFYDDADVAVRTELVDLPSLIEDR